MQTSWAKKKTIKLKKHTLLKYLGKRKGETIINTLILPFFGIFYSFDH